MPNLLSLLPTGPYAMYEPAALRLIDMLQAIDLHVHLEDYQRRVEDGTVQPDRLHSRASEGVWGDDGQGGRHVRRQDGAKPYPMSGGVAILSLTGPMMKGAAPSMDDGTSTVALRRQVRQAASDADVTAIALRIDSPGGDVSGTADLGADVHAAAQKKPLYAYIEDLGASAAYWVASQANAIYANGSALVGSIGVFGLVPDSSEMAKQKGVTMHILRSGNHKGVGAPGVPITDDQLGVLQDRVNTFAQQFVGAVNRGRGLSLKAGDEPADGRVYHASQARSLGLIDGVTSFDKMLATLRSYKPAS